MKVGFTSTSLRKYSINLVVDAAAKCGAKAIEWGTDYHIKSDKDALLAKELCDEKGIEIRSLGSYYRIGSGKFEEFEKICSLAKTMGAAYIRTWLGTKGSEKTDDKEYSALIDESLKLSEIAAKYGVIISNECHPNTFNDTLTSSLKYLDDTDGKIKTYYQSWYKDRAGDFEKLNALLPFVSDVHISFSELKKFQKFHKKDESFIPDIISELKKSDFNGCIFIEFTSGDKAENLISDIKKIQVMVNE